MDEISLDLRPIGNPAFALRQDQRGWTALVNLDVASGVALNATGMIVWKAVDGTKTVTEIIEDVRDHFSDAPPSIGEDVTAILQTLLDAGLIGFEVKL